MLHIVFLHCDCPIGSVIAYGCRNLEGAWQLGIYDHFAGFVKVMGKLAFALAVAEYIIGYMFLRFVGSVKIHFTFDCEDVAIVFALSYIVVDSLYNHR